MAGHLARCADLAARSAFIEDEAMKLDRVGRASDAAERYRAAATGLREAAAACPDNHRDRRVIEQHAREVTARAVYLDGLKSVAMAVPLEEHIHGVQLTIGPDSPTSMCASAVAVDLMGDLSPGSAVSDDVKIMGAAAAFGGATGLLLVGPVSAAALSVAAAYATTREDRTGKTARKVGSVLADRALTLDEEFRISNRAAVVIDHASVVIDQACALDSKYRISDRAKLATAHTQQALSSFNERHKVTDKLLRGLTSTGYALTGLVRKARPEERCRTTAPNWGEGAAEWTFEEAFEANAQLPISEDNELVRDELSW
mmetsp:Transcript_104692/g.223804  ORF Transcript_104692/g.223804 Transcript_104692/m.223804 type:complete len:315 (+) Transcript_104692:81-1025(+)